ncbi:MAG: RES family NAD+ phosphorylase [Bacteroidota bacterium]|nr:RES family NAD+ phosphorylase [Bacteroidota bacterium]
MIAYRLATPQYAADLSGEGASIYGGRWNPVGIKALYTSQSISLCILEILARTRVKNTPVDYQLITLEFPENLLTDIKIFQLKEGWKSHVEYTQWIGEEFLKDNKSLIMQVPSAIVERENNFILNPLHKDFSKVKIKETEALNLDKRLRQI